MSSSSAGLLFLEETKFLAGFQRKILRWTGFGGKALPDEMPEITAVRETVEEFFDIDISPEHLEELRSQLTLSTQHKSDSYIFYVLPFSAITRISYFLEKRNYQSPLYKHLPQTPEQLIANRDTLRATEIEKIQFFYFSDIQEIHHAFDPYFLSDLRLFIR